MLSIYLHHFAFRDWYTHEERLSELGSNAQTPERVYAHN
jgi:hypothetical protein